MTELRLFLDDVDTFRGLVAATVCLYLVGAVAFVRWVVGRRG